MGRLQAPSLGSSGKNFKAGTRDELAIDGGEKLPIALAHL